MKFENTKENQVEIYVNGVKQNNYILAGFNESDNGIYAVANLTTNLNNCIQVIDGTEDMLANLKEKLITSYLSDTDIESLHKIIKKLIEED